MNLERYLVRPGRGKLADHDPGDSAGLDKSAAQARTDALLQELRDLQARLYAESRQSVLVILQARDAGGKDGTVKHVFGGVNPQGVRVVGFKVPSAKEAAHDFLWRVHAEVPERGMLAIFNRSQYEDVLVPVTRGLLNQDGARRRLQHIRAFEELLSDAGTRVVKFYLHISPEEQLRRLQARLDDPHKRWKFNPGDLADRARWKEFTRAYELALSETSSATAPWYVVPADHKWFRNLVVAEVIVATLRAMNPQFPPPTFDPASVRLE